MVKGFDFLKENLKENNSLSGTNSYNGIDLIKLICSFLVCVVHVPPFAESFSAGNEINFWLQNCVARIAVPFFFTASGFLFFRKGGLYSAEPDRLKGYCFKLLRLAGLWYIILLTTKTVHLWYFGAVITAVIILYLLTKKKIKLKYIIFIAAVLYCIGLLGDAYYGVFEHLKAFTPIKLLSLLYENIVGGTRNGVFFGFLFVLLGALFAHKKIKLNKFIAAAGLIVSFAMLFAEVYILRKYIGIQKYNIYISLVPLEFFLFYIAMNLKLKDSIFYKRIRAIGVLMFCMHLAFNRYVRYGIKALNYIAGIDLSAFHFIIVILVTTAASVVVVRLSEKEKFSWLRYMYS